MSHFGDPLKGLNARQQVQREGDSETEGGTRRNLGFSPWPENTEHQPLMKAAPPCRR